jgi:hypothetical protein
VHYYLRRAEKIPVPSPCEKPKCSFSQSWALGVLINHRQRDILKKSGATVVIILKSQKVDFGKTIEFDLKKRRYDPNF